ncbi:MAG: UDP-2,3-diacylglucosamine diphosphatase LpxI [Chlamydiota bacterium]|nr:UDP-2,3-diacylglucosamine diphosphatase LpxI [Chlamydiota bacterium]
MSTLGIIAGNNNFPVYVAQQAKLSGVDKIVIAGFPDITSSAIEEFSDKLAWFGIGQLGKLIHYFKQEKAENILMAGQIPHRLVFRAMKLDLRGIKFLARHKSWNAKNLLEALIKELEEEGFQWMDSSYYLQSQLASLGILAGKTPVESQWDDIALGWRTAKQMADLDIGQTVVVKNGVVIAVEAMEGTDETIVRAGKLAGKGAVVVKVARTHQDLRYDVPLVGQTTLHSLKEAGSSVLVIEADKTLIMEKGDFLRQADELGIIVIGKKDDLGSSY